MTPALRRLSPPYAECNTVGMTKIVREAIKPVNLQVRMSARETARIAVGTRGNRQVGVDAERPARAHARVVQRAPHHPVTDPPKR